jgi:hypothetical protein
MSRIAVLFAIFFICLQSLFATADKPILTSTATTTFTPDYQQFDANRIRNWFSNVGEITSYHVTSEAGLEWPAGTGLTTVFQSGLWIAGKVNDEIRTALAEYTSEFQPGKILPNGTADDPTLAKYKIYTINRGDVTSDDYLNWPVEDGAPVDSEGKPLLLGDQTHWFVCNDLSTETHANLMNTTPIGLEAQFTIFGADHYQGIQDVMFVKILLINKGSAILDSTYVGLWSDPDLGSANDDFLGCDTINQLVYCYNGDDNDQVYQQKIPTVGFQWIQGPVVSAAGESARIMNRIIPDSRNLPMTAFNRFIGASNDWQDPETAIEAFNCLKGIGFSGVPFSDPTCNCISPFIFPGDPVTQTGWLDDIPDDRRGLFSSGPFTFAPGDTQEVILAVMMGESSDQLGGIVSLRKMVPWNNYLYQNNFQDLRLPLNLVHTKNSYNESADNYLYLQIDPDDGHSVDLPNSYVYYRVDSLGDFTAVPLLYDHDNQYHGLVTLDDDEHLLEYYFSVKDNEGQTYELPMAAPTVFYSIKTGQDQTPPDVSTEINHSYQSVLLSGKKTFHNEISITDRFAPDSIFVEYRINDGAWTAIQPEKYYQKSLAWRTDDSYTGVYDIETRIAWNNRNFGDQIEYHYIVLDSSDQRNRGISPSGFIRITHQQTWGVSEFYYPEFNYDWNADGWWIVNGGPNYPVAAKSDSASHYRNNKETVLTFNNPIPLGQYQNFSIVYSERVQVAVNDSCLVEINPDGQGWQTLYFHTNNIPVSPTLKKVVLPLENFSSANNLQFRFRFRSTEHTGDLYGWLIANINFYADTLAFGNYSESIIQDFSLANPTYPTTYANWDLNGWQFKNITTNRAIQGIAADTSSDYNNNLNTTLTYNQPVDFSEYFLAYLRLSGLHWINAGDTGFVELSPDSNLWTPIKFFTGDTNTTLPAELWYEDIEIPVNYLSGSYYFRFRFQSDANSEDNQYGWWIDKVILSTADRVAVDPEMSTILVKYSLSPAFPNPFNPITTIHYQLPEQSLVEITAYNLLGQEVKRLVKEQKPAGAYSITWNATNLPSGIYLIRMTAGDFHSVRKCILLK